MLSVVGALVVQGRCPHIPATLFLTLRFGEFSACFFTDDVILLPSLHSGCQLKLEWFAVQPRVECLGQGSGPCLCLRSENGGGGGFCQELYMGVDLSVSGMLFCKN